MLRPIPFAPSTAHTRFGYSPTAASISTKPSSEFSKRRRVNKFSVESSTAIVLDALCGSIPMITISSIDRVPFSLLLMTDKEGQRAWFSRANLSSATSLSEAQGRFTG